MFWKFRLMAAGPMLTLLMEPDGFSSVMLFDAELAEMGKANGGLELSPVTMLVVGSCVMIAYPARTEVLPSRKGSHAKPIRGWKFLLLVWYGCKAGISVPVVGSKFVNFPAASEGVEFHA